MRTLLVEDDALTRAIVSELLRRRGHEVRAFSDAESAWQACQEENFPLAVLDWMLPGMDGLELCRRLRALPGWADSLILLLTARESPGDLQAALDAGADDYLPKSAADRLLQVRLAIAERRLADIERRKRAEAEALRAKQTELEAAALRELSRRQRLLLDLVSHELHTPLGPILGYSELLLAEADWPAPRRRQLEAIYRGARQLEQLAQQVLDLTRLQDGRGQLDLQPVALATSLAGWLSDLADPPRLQVSAGPDLPRLQADPVRLRVAIRCLAEHALARAPAHAGVEVRAELAQRAEAAVRVLVRVVGAAVPWDHFEDPLESLKPSPAQGARLGLGVGLALARRVAEAHGGGIRLEPATNQASGVALELPIEGCPPNDHSRSFRSSLGT